VIDRAASVITAMGIMTREEMDEILEELSHPHCEISLRWFAAQDPDASPEVLEFLANAKDPLTRFYVVNNPNTSRNLLACLAEDMNRYVAAEALAKLVDIGFASSPKD
jgi:hypothetical protein